MADKLILDANALLNAVFISTSWSRLAINLALKNGAKVFIGYRSNREATGIAVSLARELRKKTDPRDLIETYIRNIRAFEVHPDRCAAVPEKIPRHDSHVVREAHTAKAQILTSDHELWLACKSTGVPATLPLEVVRRYDGFSMATTVFGVPPTRRAGCIFARAHPGNWADLKVAERFSIIDIPGVLWIHYNAETRQWVVDFDGQGTLAVGTDIADQCVQTVALSWREKKTTLRVAGVEHPSQRNLERPLGPPTAPTATIGHHRSGQHYWNGTIYYCVMNDKAIGRDGWRALCKDPELSPNPFDSDRLRAAISALA